ncbi:MAG: hypothetical protein ACR65O_09130 [Methylomicrobium sp.]
MKIPPEIIANTIASAQQCYKSSKRRSLDRSISVLRRKMHKALHDHMQGPMVLLEESLRFLIAFEQYQHTRELNEKTSPFAFRLALVRSDLLSIRELVNLGQESAALALGRVFIENVEVAMALSIDPVFAIAYFNAENSDEFWSKNIGYGKIYPYVQRFFEYGGRPIDEVIERLQFHKTVKSFLSEHIHPTPLSALKATFPPSLKNPGMFENRPLGAVGENIASLCLFLAEETLLFAGCCVNIFIGPNPPPALSDYAPNKLLREAMTAAHVLQELSTEYLDEFHRIDSEIKKRWKIALSFDDKAG